MKEGLAPDVKRPPKVNCLASVALPSECSRGMSTTAGSTHPGEKQSAHFRGSLAAARETFAALDALEVPLLRAADAVVNAIISGR